MSAYWNSASNSFSASKKLLIFVLLTFSLLGCKTTTPISNGQNIADLSGKAGSDKMFSVTVPENIDGLLIEVAGSPDISLDLLDADENSLGACVAATRCLLNHPSAAKYLIKLSATADYSGVNISASWGGPEDTVLYNNVEITELTGNEQSLLLKSFYVGINNGPVTFTSTGLNSATLEIADQYGETIETCANADSCSVNGLSEGLFFARILGAAEFTQGTFTASWGNPADTTLRNGVKKAVSGSYGDVVLESLYLQNGASDIMVHANSSGIELEILDEDGIHIGYCNGESCHASGLARGVYYIRARITETSVTSSIMASWAGVGVHSMRNGDQLSALALANNERLSRSIYIDDAGSNVMVMASDSGYGDIVVYSHTGDTITGCGMGTPCTFEAPYAGTYFVVAYNFSPETLNFSLSAAWGNSSVATLPNGGHISGLSLPSNENLIQSLYIDDAGSNVMVMASDSGYGDIVVYSHTGDTITGCGMGTPCTFEAPYAGTYFVVAYNFSPENLDFNLALAWSNSSTSTIGKGIPLSLGGSAGEISLGSLYLDQNSTLTLTVSGPVMTELSDSSGAALEGCSDTCTVSNLPAGHYFVINYFQDSTNSASLLVDW